MSIKTFECNNFYLNKWKNVQMKLKSPQCTFKHTNELIINSIKREMFKGKKYHLNDLYNQLNKQKIFQRQYLSIQ